MVEDSECGMERSGIGERGECQKTMSGRGKAWRCCLLRSPSDGDDNIDIRTHFRQRTNILLKCESHHTFMFMHRFF